MKLTNVFGIILLGLAGTGTLLGAQRAIGAPSTLTLFVLETGIALAVGIGLSMWLGRKEGRGPRCGDSSFSGHQVGRLFLSLFLVLVALSLITLSRGQYVAPLSFYISIGTIAGTVGLDIALNGNRRSAARILGQITILAVVVKFHFFYLNPYVYSSDSFLIYLGIKDIASTGYVPTDLGFYYYFPGFPIFARIAGVFAAVPLELYAVFNFAALVASVLIVYLIGREVANVRLGLFAALGTVFTAFYFLSTHYNPGLFGVPFMLGSIYALVKGRERKQRSWLGVFWPFALLAIFSHPVNGLTLGVFLLVRFLLFRVTGRVVPSRAANVTPILSYGVVFLSYLTFIAVIAFSIFAQALLSRPYSPPLATAVTSELAVDPRFVIESALAPSSVAFLLFLAAIAIFRPIGDLREHAFFVLSMVVLIVTPAAEFAFSNFALQSTRTLLYLAIPTVFLAAGTVTRLAMSARRGWKRLGSLSAIFILFALFAFMASSSYLTQNDLRTLYPQVPAATTHITETALASRDFLSRLTPRDEIYMDPGSFFYFSNNFRSRDALAGLNTLPISAQTPIVPDSYIVVNPHFLLYGDPSSGKLFDFNKITEAVEHSLSHRLYDNGAVQVYAIP